MKSDIDRLMGVHELDAILVVGPAQHNPDMSYLTGSVHVTGADLIKARGNEPILYHSSMERDEAARSGLRARNLEKYPFNEFMKQAAGDRALALALRYQQMLAEQGITTGRLGVYGKVSVGPYFAIFSHLQRLAPEIEIVGELGNTVFLEARATKDDAEIERIRRMGQITTAVVGQTAEFLSSHAAKDGILVDGSGQALTIGDVKRCINLWLAERGADNPEGCIFAIGRDAGVPHSSGNPEDVLRLGQTIVFDIFPCEAGGGYHYDFTRTWCLGYAPDDVQALYDDVLAVYRQIMGELKAGTPCQPYQQRTCELFEEQGHPTVLSTPGTQDGYVHSLGHGLGLDVHEAPWFGATASERDRLDPGVVVTIEPGLYYPERGMGCRLEDTVWVRPDGELEILVEYPLDLVLPVRQG
jgi:Xaa-Pro aminopeptidase